MLETPILNFIITLVKYLRQIFRRLDESIKMKHVSKLRKSAQGIF